jgi:CubicO group peptidase (beta-lactamase class C family)
MEVAEPSTVESRLEPAFAVLDRYVERLRVHYGTPGLTLALTDRERTLRIATYGFADVAARAAVVPETLFEFGSIGKSFTALVFLRLRERGLIDLQSPVSRYLPWFSVRSSDEPIRLHHLLCHTGGIVMGTDASLDGRYEAWALRELEVSAPPGERFWYSNVGYKTLGYVLEELLGRSYDEIVRNEILAPLGMDATICPITSRDRPRIAVPYRRLFDDRPTLPIHPLVPDTWVESGTADGGLAAPPGDMAVYLRLLINRGAHPGGRLVADESFALMTERHAIRPWGDDSLGYGYGLMTSELDGRPHLGHSGGMVGHYSSLLIDTEAGLGAFVAVNGPGDPFRPAAYALKAVRAALAGEELPDPPEVADQAKIENAAALAGTYFGQAGTLRLVAAEDGLLLERDGLQVPLLKHGAGHLIADHPAFGRFAFVVEREDEAVVGIGHGGEWYGREGAAVPDPSDHPAAWAAYPGKYRCWNPWEPTFQVVLRRGRLILTYPSGQEATLTGLTDRSFRIWEEGTPERLTFDPPVDGRTLRAALSGQAYYRVPDW